jgi:hypothetical protein
VAPACPPAPRRFHARHGIADQALDLLGRVGAALRQAAHLAGHHREAAALLAGARRFHRRVQRQDVGLERCLDHADDVDDLARRRVDLVHGLHHAAHRFAAAQRRLRRRGRQPVAWRALSAFWRTVPVSCSMLEAVSSSDAACCSVRCDRSLLPAAT